MPVYTYVRSPEMFLSFVALQIYSRHRDQGFRPAGSGCFSKKNRKKYAKSADPTDKNNLLLYFITQVWIDSAAKTSF